MEELKLILESIQSLGADAKTTFIIWILVRYLAVNLLHYSCVALFLFVLYKILSPLVQGGLISQIKGIMNYQGELEPAEKQRIIETLKKGLEKK